MGDRSQPLPIALWFLGGLSIVIVGVQAVLALLGVHYLNSVPVVGIFVRTITSIAIFDQAAMVTFRERGTVFFLFLLVLTGWLGGLLMMVNDRVQQRLEPTRSWSGGALGVVVLTYLALYGGVYRSLVSEPLPAHQYLLLYLVPIGSSSMLVAGWLLFPWTQDRLDDIIKTLEQAERVAENQRENFEELLSNRVGITEDRLAALISSEGVVSIDLDPIERTVQQFRKESEEISREARREADHLKSLEQDDLEESLDSKRSSADRWLERAQGLDPEGTIEIVSRDLTEVGETILDDYFDSIEEALQSRYNDRYAVSNLSEEYAQVTGDVAGGSIELADDEDEMRQRLLSKIRSEGDGDKSASVVLMEGIGILERVQDHVNETVRPHLKAVETEFAERSELVKGDLEAVDERLSGLDGQTGKTLRKILVEGEGDETLGIPAVHETLEEARTALHECRFGSSAGVYSWLDEAESMIEDLQRCVLFVEGIFLQAISEGEPRVALRYLPSDYEYPFFTEELLESLEGPILEEYGARYSVDVVEKEIRIDYEDKKSLGEDEVNDNDQKVDRSVEFLIERISEKEPTDGAQVVELDLGTVPDYVLRTGAMNRLADFFSASNVITAENVPAEDETDPIRLRANGEMNMRTALTILKEEYEEWSQDD
jgi:hypothetical protein